MSSGSNTAANVIRGIDSGSNNYFAFDNQNGPSSFAISGSQALTITAEVGVNLNSSSDESGFVSAVNLNGSAASGALRLAGLQLCGCDPGWFRQRHLLRHGRQRCADREWWCGPVPLLQQQRHG